MDIVIDFDGTVVTHEFPRIGKPIGAEPVLRAIVEKGHNLILFTMRSDVSEPYSKDRDIITEAGNYLTDAVNWFEERKIKLFGIQTNPKQKTWTSSPKAYGKIIIDDAALGCPLKFDKNLCDKPFVDWEMVTLMLIDRNVIKNIK